MKKTKTTAELVAEGKVPPQYLVPKSTGDAPVRRWIALLPAWQSDLASQVHEVVTAAFPQAIRAVKWHGVFYGAPGAGWFLAMHGFKAHLKLTFFDGLSLSPAPPVALAKAPNRALDLREADGLDAGQLARWVEQAKALPGWGRA